MVIAAISSLILLAVIVIFAFPQFSPIPYFPSNMKDRELILKGLDLKNGQTVIDLGAGDGVVIFEAASYAAKHGLDTRFVALEINPVLLLIMGVKWLMHPNRASIKIICGDMFTIDYRSITKKNNQSVTFYLYISPWLIEKAIAQTAKSFPHACYVSYYYPIKSLKKIETVRNGVHDLYLYP